jgi:hypothetical protein
VVEFVSAIVGQEIFEGLVEESFIFGVSEGSADKHGRTISNVGGDDFVREFGAMEVTKHGVNGVDEIKSGVDQGAVEIEDDELDRAGIKQAGHKGRIAKTGRRSRR